ncbi:unnamed protein product [Rangifer tarandus platyrhynchus]|uniref:Uncharacterized protein n=1 Tax=Rangifer tarandus platyrhynchus TaxID=3082113 RepID=A0ACB1MK26_RANTA
MPPSRRAGLTAEMPAPGLVKRERTAPFRGTKVALKAERRFLFLMDKPKNQSRRCSREPHSRRARGRERSAPRRCTSPRRNTRPPRAPAEAGLEHLSPRVPERGSDRRWGGGWGRDRWEVPADAPGWPRPHRSHLPAPALRRPPAPERPSPDPEMWTRSGRPRLEQDDRSLCERPRGLGSPGSLRRAGAGSPAGVSGSGTSAAACPAGSPGGSAGLLPASAIGSRRPGARGGAGAADRAARRAATPRQRQGRRRLDAGRGEAGGEGGRRKRTEKFVQEGAAYSRLSLPRAKAAGLGAGPPSVPASLPAAPPPGPGHGPLQIGGRRVPSGHTQLAGLRLVEPGRQELGMQGQG